MPTAGFEPPNNKVVIASSQGISKPPEHDRRRSVALEEH